MKPMKKMAYYKSKGGTPSAGSPINKLNFQKQNVKGGDMPSPVKHYGHYPWTNADHSIADHAKNFIQDPVGTVKKELKTAYKKTKRGVTNVGRNLLWATTYGPMFDIMGYDHPFSGKSGKDKKKITNKKEEKKKTRRVTKKKSKPATPKKTIQDFYVETSDADRAGR